MLAAIAQDEDLLAIPFEIKRVSTDGAGGEVGAERVNDAGLYGAAAVAGRVGMVMTTLLIFGSVFLLARLEELI